MRLGSRARQINRISLSPSPFSSELEPRYTDAEYAKRVGSILSKVVHKREVLDSGIEHEDPQVGELRLQDVYEWGWGMLEDQFVSDTVYAILYHLSIADKLTERDQLLQLFDECAKGAAQLLQRSIDLDGQVRWEGEAIRLHLQLLFEIAAGHFLNIFVTANQCRGLFSVSPDQLYDQPLYILLLLLK